MPNQYTKNPRSPQEHFWEKVREAPSGCWEWVGASDEYGYGSFRISRHDKGKTWTTHRLAWRWLRGPLPSWLEIDHLCNSPPCVNPAHLQLVPRGFNGRQGSAVASANRRAKTHCKWGHAFTEDNIYMISDGSRECRKCRRRMNHDGLIRRRDAGRMP